MAFTINEQQVEFKIRDFWQYHYLLLIPLKSSSFKRIQAD